MKSLDTVRRFASQIFCEMLGQVCHSQFYTNDEMNYQEVHSISITWLICLRASSFMEVMTFYPCTTLVFLINILWRFQNMEGNSTNRLIKQSFFVGRGDFTCETPSKEWNFSNYSPEWCYISQVGKRMLDICTIMTKILFIKLYPKFD